MSLKACPCIDAHRRLMDVHEDIHRAIDNYHEPEEFRRSLNSAIQSARSVTFLIQKRKSKWADFDDWYGTWVATSKLNPVLAWSVHSRNKIVKEEDLKTSSVAEIGIYGPRLKVLEDAFVVPAATTAEDVLRIIAQPSQAGTSQQNEPIPAGDPAEMTIRVRRKWIDSGLPHLELVSALREVYRGVAHVVEEAHTRSQVDRCTAPHFSRSCVNAEIDAGLGCMGPDIGGSVMFLDGRTGEVRTPQYVRVNRDPDMDEAFFHEHYGIPTPTFGKGPIGDLEARLEMARAMVRTEGFAGQFLMFYYGDEPFSFAPLTFESDRPREAKIEMAVEGLGARSFDGALFVTELWMGTGTSGGEKSEVTPTPNEDEEQESSHYARDTIGGRKEAISVIGLSAHSTPRQLIQVFRRVDGEVEFDKPFETRGWNAIPPLLRPVVRGFSKRSSD
ncbi:hypothetical protein L1277_002713 [Okibacterium sp. HSC-33S16]|uniref:hypothetical protein n=1 Tax=Okibacterium sp. HSC-33S16 TaxID=2910965 RepID=UPI00209F47A4|nr:hypothetical protein [Okibacterium sp. HSC-33S16]MCP2032603.1 hypothetical protein [Okibacterium sp. HSC-33S16]